MSDVKDYTPASSSTGDLHTPGTSGPSPSTSATPKPPPLPPAATAQLDAAATIYGSNSFRTLVDACAVMTARYYEKLIEEGVPVEVAGVLTASFASNMGTIPK